jgi:hypothetical protein
MVDDLPAPSSGWCPWAPPEYQPITQRGDGFNTASVVDPFGNVLGVLHNRHYLAVAGG